MLGNVPVLWELTLACMKLGCPVIPTTTLLMPSDLADRLQRGAVRAVVTDPLLAERFNGMTDDGLRVLTHGSADGWHTLPAPPYGLEEFKRQRRSGGKRPAIFLFYFPRDHGRNLS